MKKRGKYKIKEENLEKLKIFLTKINKNDGKYNRLGESDIKQYN